MECISTVGASLVELILNDTHQIIGDFKLQNKNEKKISKRLVAIQYTLALDNSETTAGNK